jgi:hypothetical protein
MSGRGVLEDVRDVPLPDEDSDDLDAIEANEVKAEVLDDRKATKPRCQVISIRPSPGC